MLTDSNDNLAIVDLRILTKLYDPFPDASNLIAAHMLEPAIDGITIDDVKARLRHLGSLDELHGYDVPGGLFCGRLSPLMRQRLDEPAPRIADQEGDTWIERIRWLLAGLRQPGAFTQARDALLDHPLRPKAFEPP